MNTNKHESIDIKKLLDGVKVEWKALGEVCEIKTGQPVSKEIIAKLPGQYAVINSGREPLGFIDQWNTENDPIGITSRGAGVGSITWQSGKYFRGNLNYSVSVKDESELEVRFLYHLLFEMQIEIQALCTYDGIPALNSGNLKKLQIPIPPLLIQKEIVRILDTFTELTTELTHRKKQYNHYRNQLLSFQEGTTKGTKSTNGSVIEWKTLGEICDIASGGTPSTAKPEYWKDGDVPWLKSESCNNMPVFSANHFITELGLNKSSAKLFQKGTTLMALVGATIFKTAYLEFESSINQNMASIKPKEGSSIANKYIFYFLTNMYAELKSKMSNYGMLNLTTLRTFKIPIPHPNDPEKSLAEQARIVAILDKFDTLTHSISEGLPREIELRQKQYEYYRNLLLNFPKPKEVVHV